MSPSHEQNIQHLQLLHKMSVELRRLPTDKKNQVLMTLVKKLRESSKQLLDENSKDIESYKKDPQFSSALLDRLQLTESRIQGMITGLETVIKMPDPRGQIVSERKTPQGFVLKQIRESFGVILFIFEARPNVILEAFSLGFKSGNILLFKNGKEAKHSSQFLYELIVQSLRETGVSPDFIWGLPQASREQTLWLMQQDRYIDLLIPRGGDQLIEVVKANSRIPIIQNDRGLCHLYVDEQADLNMALQILLNGKTQRPGVCNALETLLVHEKIANQFLPLAQKALQTYQVQWWVCPQSVKILSPGPEIHKATAATFDTEYLELKLSCKVVKSSSEAIEHINQHGSKHSEVIITQNENLAREFQQNVDAAVVYWNASSRFTDGFEFGLGGEIGISTQKLHIRGPVGLESLTSLRWIVDGTGQVRS